MEHFGQALAGIFGRLWTLLSAPGSQFSLTSLSCALLVAVALVAMRRISRKRRLRLRATLRTLFPRRVIRHKSLRADAGFFLFNVFVYAGVAGYAAISYQFLTNAIVDGLVAALGAPEPVLPLGAARGIVTLMLFLAYELGYWIDHYLKHRVPALWELHKAHHTAEVLTPLTTFRMHPLDTWFFANILAVTMATVSGVASWFFGDTAQQYVISGNNLLLVLFIHAYVHLQHTHVWIAFRGWAGRIFLSPAHHQIHHSTDPTHFNRNFGSCLALWDWMFGTLHVPAAKREKMTFGVLPARVDVHSLTAELIAPVGHALAALLPARKPAGMSPGATSSAAE
ncbi:MAG: sterol desaturase family protein [Alphaproteobacteria bacterium]